MLLSIIIPQYKESDKDVRRLLSSIDYQLNVDWNEVEVIIVNDHSNVLLSDTMLNNFENIKPKYIKLDKNVGPGLARQAGFDEAIGEYVTFCDADDMYQNFGVISLYLSTIKEKHPDIIRTQWVEELEVNGAKQYITHNFEATWMHGKCFRKQFFIENNIRFSEKLLYHEDSYILSNAFETTSNVVDIPTVTYVWTFDKNSITRRNNGSYSYESIPEFIRAITYSVEWVSEKHPEKVQPKICQLLLYIYYMLQSNSWNKEHVIPIEKEAYNTYKLFGNCVEKINVNLLASLDLQERQKVGNRAFVQTETFIQWINRVVSENNSN